MTADDIVVDPIALLRREHDEALAALDRLEAGTKSLETPGARAAIEEAVSFLDDDVRGHNEREEECLFPVLERHLPPVGPTAVMRAEHRELWELLAGLKQALGARPLDPRSVRMSGLAVVDLLRRHIEKENQILFPMSQHLLSPAEMGEVGRGMAELIARRRAARAAAR